MKDKEEKIMLNQTIKRLESEKNIHAKHQKVEENEKGILNDKIQTLQLQKEILSKDLEEKIENDKKNKIEIEKLQQKINELNEYITKKDNEMKNILETQKSKIGNEEKEKNELKASINKLNESIKEKDNIIKEFKEKYDSENQVKNLLNATIIQLNQKIKTLESKGKEENEIKEDERIFVLLEFEENKLLSGTDNNIHLWDLNSNSEKYKKSFKGHEYWVNGLVKIDDKTFASASNDGAIKSQKKLNKKN